MTNEEFKRTMMLPEAPARGPIDWLRVAVLIVVLICCVAFWIAFGYAAVAVLS